MTPQYRHSKCAACDKPFTKEDDIVICPECGAPYHRACYAEKGHCVFEEKHGSGFEYKLPEHHAPSGFSTPAGETVPEEQGITCHNCGTVNTARNIFCEQCGAPLHTAQSPAFPFTPYPFQQQQLQQQQQTQAQTQTQQPPSPQQTFQQPPVSPPVFTYPPTTSLDMNGEIDGFAKKDWAAFIGPSASTYLHRFSNMQFSNTKISFSPSAFFLGPFYFAYRKMWGWAAITFVNVLIVNAFNLLWFLSTNSSPLVAGLSTQTLDVLSNVFFYIGFGVQLFFGIFALYLYRLHIAKKLKALRQKYPDENEYHMGLVHTGGVSGIGLGIVFAILFLLAGALSQWIGPELLQYYYASLW